jgi:hypothetical protein
VVNDLTPVPKQLTVEIRVPAFDQTGSGINVGHGKGDIGDGSDPMF